MASLNKVFLIGRLTRDPELRYLPNGTPKAELRLATSREWKDKNGEKQKDTCYVDVIVWSRQAEIAKQYLAKGRQIFVEGRLDYQEWEKDGVKRSKHQVIADYVQFLDRMGGGAEEGAYGGGERFAGAGAGMGGGDEFGGGGGGGGYGGGGNGGYGGRSYGGKTYGGNATDDGGNAPHSMSEVMGVGESDLPF
ncbi:MAG: single-stranded DNA-binding protein [Planctomycetota bacterium]|nr:single-stranded DNA-binding protein [Planctomycetota bacterium]